jgi:hypothetical protein
MYAHVYDQGVKHTWIRSCNMSIDTLSGCYNRFVLYMDPNSVRRKTTHTLTHTHTHTHTQTHTQHLMSTRSCNLSIEKLSSGWTARLILHVRTMCSQLRKFYPRSDCTLGSGARTQHNIDLERFSSTKTFAHDKRMDCATDLTRTNHVESAVQVNLCLGPLREVDRRA